MMMRIKDRFTGKMFIRLWIPAFISAVGWALSDMADAIVVGIRLGTTGLAAISLILPVYMVNCMFAHALGIGGSVRFSKLLGQGKQEEAIQNFNTILWGMVFFSLFTAASGSILMNPLLALLGTTPEDGGLFLAARDYLEILVLANPLFYLSNLLNYYLRNDNNQKLAGIGSAAGNVSDIAMNIVMVLVVGMGTRGAALSTVIGHVISIAFYLPGILGRSDTLRIKKMMPHLKEFFGCFKAGMASSVQYLFQVIFFLACNNVLIRSAGVAGVAVFDLIQNTSYLILYLYEGTSKAMQPLVSTYHGEHYEAGKRKTFRLGLLFGSIPGLCVTVFVFLFPEILCSLFGLRGTFAYEMGCMGLRIYCPATLFAGISIVIGGYYQFCEKERESFFITFLRGFLILIPCTVFFSTLDTNWFWYLFPVTEILSLGLYGCKRIFMKEKAQGFDAGRIFTRTIESTAEDVILLAGEAEGFCQKWGADRKQCYFVTMAVEEICMAILNGGFTPVKDGYIQFTLVALEEGDFKLHIRDNAITFNPFTLETGKADEVGFDMEAMGIKVIKNKMKDTFYRRYQGFNTLVIRF